MIMRERERERDRHAEEEHSASKLRVTEILSNVGWGWLTVKSVQSPVEKGYS